jgi:hypothetical protein
MKNYETNVYDYIDSKTGAHVVKATTIYGGKAIYAYAKCDPEDEFDLEFGTKIALKRLDIKIAQKRISNKKEDLKVYKHRLTYIENEKRRTKKSIEQAEISVIDRKIKLKKLEAELEEILTKV